MKDMGFFMNEQNGILLLNYDIDEYGRIRISGTRRSGSGGRPPVDPPPEGSGCGAAAFGAFITFFLGLIFDFNIVLSLVFAFIVAMVIYKSKKNS